MDILDEKIYKIYILQNNINKKVYIGQTSGTLKARFIKHRCLTNKKNLHLYNAFNKYGRENFSIELLMDNLTIIEANFWEPYYIEIFDSRNRKRGYNIKEGGASGKLALETIEKMRKTHSIPEIRKRKSEKLIGANSPLFGKKGKDAPAFGRKHTEEELQKMAESRSGDKSNLAKFTKETIIALRLEYKEGKLNKTQLAKKYGTSRENVRRILKNKTWRYVII